MSTAKKSVILRIDPSLWEELNTWAQDELRSLNGQIEYLLRDAVRKRKKGRKSQDGDNQGERETAFNRV